MWSITSAFYASATGWANQSFIADPAQRVCRVSLDSFSTARLDAEAASQRVMRKAGLQYERDIVHAGLPHLLFRTGNTLME
jgi:hypothetical protein